MSGYSKGSPAIILDDIDSLINVKKEGPQDVPKSSNVTPAPKIARAASSRKRKISEPNPFEGLDSEETLARMLSLMTLGCQKVTEGLQEATRCHIELQSAALEKNHYIHNLQQDLDSLKGKIVAMELRHAEEVAHIKDSTKHSIATLILQDRIRMAREAQDASFDRSSWDVEGWEKRLEELGGQAAESSKKNATTPMAPEDKGKSVVEVGEMSMVVSRGDDDGIEKV